MYNRQSNIYRRVAVDSAPPTRILSELLDGLLADLSGAAECIEARDVVGKARRVNRALAIIGALDAALDRAAAPELTANLARLYDFAKERLLHASAHMETAPLLEAEQVLAPIRDAFAQAARRA